MFNFRLLSTFVAVAELKHFGLAADQLHATQPGVSQHIAKLEADLGVKLIERTKRSVELTLAGEVFLTHAKMVLSMLERMKNETQRISQGLQGEVTLGLTPSAINSDIPSRIKEFRRNVPDVNVKLRVHSGVQLKPLLDYGEIDAIITTLPVAEGVYKSTVISQQAMGVAILASHPLARRQHLSIRTLRNEPFIVVPRHEHPKNHDTLIARFRSLGVPLNITAYETSFQNVLARVAIGEGVGIVALGYQSTGPRTVSVLPLRDPDLSWSPIYSIVRADNSQPATARLLEALRAYEGQPSGLEAFSTEAAEHRS
ncbi:LysR family transcriptional regulator [Pusillimonas noertemannii]|uniref:LysR family transcriptional regulator n=2 Tax=Pusillimonas noertemannii TaxID=305977 RepID=UPI00031A5B76|nr:LysR family transcriptional regulator [Pusillimonas noertemannii]